MFPQMLNWKMNVAIATNGWVFAKLPLQILQIKHKCLWAILQIPCYR